jgi:hypothetical protein
MDTDTEFSNFALEHIIKFITNEGDCLFDAISYSLKYLRNSIKT